MMVYHWQVYKASFKHTLQGYVFAQSEEEAEAAWKAQLKRNGVNALPADHFDVMEDAEFYLTSDAEGGHIIFLHPDELVDHVIESKDVYKPCVFYVKH